MKTKKYADVDTLFPRTVGITIAVHLLRVAVGLALLKRRVHAALLRLLTKLKRIK